MTSEQTSAYSCESNVVPFLKWAGGKRWLVRSHGDVFPESFNRYYEPFLGSGAVFFGLAPSKATLSDSNGDLIATYAAIKRDAQRVYRNLARHHNRHSHDYYYDMRASRPRSTAGKAARFIYLNRTCWNALYRVNLNGEFNVPKGSKDSVKLPTDDFAAIAEALKSAELEHCDFRRVIPRARRGDFVFADPPYTVKHNLNGFVKYNETIFSWDDQCALRDMLVEATDRGVLVLCTNADHPSIHELYRRDFYIRKVERNSVVAASSDNRSRTTELLISNY